MERRFAQDINHQKFLPYLQLHEFEALLFSSDIGFQKYLDDEQDIQKIQQIIAQFNSPEEIDESDDTALLKGSKKYFQNMRSLSMNH
jgi:hypothetical protein